MNVIDSFIEASQNCQALYNEINILCEKWYEVHLKNFKEKYINSDKDSFRYSYCTVPTELLAAPTDSNFQYIRISFVSISIIDNSTQYHEVKAPIEEILNTK